MSLRREWWEIWAIAVVYKISLEDEVVIHSDLENIADAIRDFKMSSPAVFVTGHGDSI